jgi:hypothetical protein
VDLKKRGALDNYNLIGSFGSAKADLDQSLPRFSALISDEMLRKGAEFVESGRDVNYPLMAPPGTPDETVKILRDAYASVVKDPRFVKEAGDLGEFTLAPTTGEDMAAIIKHQLEAGDAVMNAARQLVQ